MTKAPIDLEKLKELSARIQNGMAGGPEMRIELKDTLPDLIELLEQAKQIMEWDVENADSGQLDYTCHDVGHHREWLNRFKKDGEK